MFSKKVSFLALCGIAVVFRKQTQTCSKNRGYAFSFLLLVETTISFPCEMPAFGPLLIAAGHLFVAPRIRKHTGRSFRHIP